MSKLIVEMEMPKSCDACPLLDESGDYPMCIATQETRGYNFDTRNKKMDKCPIKGVLPDEHGDLIDRDEVKQKMIHYGFHAIDMTATEFCEDELQTVIAAERKRR